MGSSTPYSTVGGQSALLVGDLNGNNQLDVVGDSIDGNPDFDELLNNGDGTFRTGAPFATDYYGGPGQLGDLDGDGNLDLVYTEGPQTATMFQLQVALGKGGGTFILGAKFGYLTGPPLQIAVGDFNQDGVLDVVTPNGSKSGLFLGVGDGTFRQGTQLNLQPEALVAADINGDGKLDIVAAYLVDFQNIQIQALLGNGDGTFQKARTVARPSGFLRLVVTDVNGDGNEDIVFQDFTNNWVIRGNGDGTFRKAQLYPLTGILTVGDFNSDGKVDLVQGMDNAISYMAGNGDGTFGAAQITPISGFVLNVANGDFNADGLLDLVIPQTYSGVNIYLQQ